MKWSNILSSLERHFVAIKKGQDYDEETGLLHSAHIMANAAFLTEFYKIYPQGDDRIHTYLYTPRIGLDIEGILTTGTENNKSTSQMYWASVFCTVDPTKLQFSPTCYLTRREIPEEWTRSWLQNAGFPNRPIYTVKGSASKVEVAKQARADIFIVSDYSDFVELNRHGVCCYLLDTKTNAHFDVGYKRIKNLTDLRY